MKKLSCKSLMIGDWVRYRGTDIRVTSLYDKGDSNEIGWSDKESVWVNGDNVDPMPITGKKLKANGFKYDELEECYEWQQGYNATGISAEVRLVQDDKSWLCYLFGPKLGMEIEELNIAYVHELQHAMRLVGIEKEIDV